MQIITLTTDYGDTDHYAGSLKGAILSANRDLQIVDISHHIQQYSIVHGAYVLKYAFKTFPKGSVHVIHVQHHGAGPTSWLGFNHMGHSFIGPDNGIFSMMFDTRDISFFKLPGHESQPGAFRMIVAQTIQKILSGTDFQAFAMPAEEIVRKITLNPVVMRDQIRATVIHVDHYENAILNVCKEDFEKYRDGRDFEIYYRKEDPLTKVSHNYWDVPVGEVLCLFNDNGLLELAINMGHAASMLELHVDDTIQIKFAE